MSSLKGDKIPCARLCHIVKWDDFDGYGFNLHAEKGKNGQFIGKVDDGSPSQAAGLRQGDRIIEVNEINIANETHKQVVERIKAFPNETKLLVVDQEADEYFRANNIVIKGTMANVKVIKTPERIRIVASKKSLTAAMPPLMRPHKNQADRTIRCTARAARCRQVQREHRPEARTITKTRANAKKLAKRTGTVLRTIRQRRWRTCMEQGTGTLPVTTSHGRV